MKRNQRPVGSPAPCPAAQREVGRRFGVRKKGLRYHELVHEAFHVGAIQRLHTNQLTIGDHEEIGVGGNGLNLSDKTAHVFGSLDPDTVTISHTRACRHG